MSWFRGGDTSNSNSSSQYGQQQPSAPSLPARRQPQAAQGGPGAAPAYSANMGYSTQQPQQGYGNPAYHQQSQQYPATPARRGGGNTKFEVVPLPQDSLALMNRLVVSPADFDASRTPYLRVSTSRGQHFPFAIHTDPGVHPGQIAMGKDQRAWCFVRKEGDFVDVEPIDPDRETGGKSYLATATLEVGFYTDKNGTDAPFDSEALESDLRKRFDGNLLAMNQPLVHSFQNLTLRLVVRSLTNVDLSQGGAAPSGGSGGSSSSSSFGLIMSRTELTFVKTEGSRINLKASSKRAAANAVVKPDFNFSDMGIGGLDDEFQTMFRRAFASRIFPPGLVEKLGIQHVKGILLYGPPGTGKTLMARQIGKMLNAREPKIVNGPEVLNKFVGQSEENIRKLFADAEKEYKAKGDESGLHIIIFDELDAICKQRGSSGSSTGVGDSIVNQLLSKMDGVDQLNNILIIGMTNRMDMIDEALLRAGRLEVHMEISLPNEFGRLQILNIHTSKMRNNGIMDTDVSLEELAAQTKNFSGAEIGGLVKSATSFAFNRHVKVGTTAGISDDVEKLKVNRADFMHAMEEVKPLFGVAEEELAQVVQNGIIDYDIQVESILRDGELVVKQVRESPRSHLVSTLMWGPAGSGKTALAATIAQRSEFPFIKLISAENMVGYTDASKIQYMSKIFTDAHKSPMSVIVVDSVETIIDYIPVGPRFSAPVLVALKVLMRKLPPKNRRLLVLATTTNRNMIEEMDLLNSFDSEIAINTLNTLESIMAVVEAVDLYKPNQPGYNQIQTLLARRSQEGNLRLEIGIKRLLSLIEMARQDLDDPAGKLVKSLESVMRSQQTSRYM